MSVHGIDPAGVPAALREGLERCLDALRDDPDGQALLAALDDTARTTLPRVWACSPFIARTCLRRPAMLRELVASGALRRSLRPDDYRERIRAATADAADETTLKRRLREIRAREMVRIGWRDLAGLAPLAETVRDLSALADACLQAALDRLHAMHAALRGTPVTAAGRPQRLVVIAMGKLGARELNFSSDIDLMLAYPDSGETRGARRPESCHEFFTRLGQRLVQVLGENLDNGFVFRVDMRLRPFGDAGPLVNTFAAMEDYYQAHGRDWERYAMIRARVAAGDRRAGEALLRQLQPFVFRRYLDYGIFDSLRAMKDMIDGQVRKKGIEDDIKRGPGGIREVEFIAQALQLVRGGQIPALRTRRLRTAFRALVANGDLDPGTGRALIAAYEFLRNCEHRIQQINDQQTHVLPDSEADRVRVAFGMGFADTGAFLAALDAHRRVVETAFAAIFSTDGAPGTGDGEAASPWGPVWRGTAHDAAQGLAAAGFRDPGNALDRITALRESLSVRRLSDTGRRRLDRVMPRLLSQVADAPRDDPPPDVVLERVLDVIETIAQRSVYLSLLSEQPVSLEQLVRLCRASPWITHQIKRHPALLDELMDPRSLYAPPDRDELEVQMVGRFSGVPDDDEEQQLEVLRQFRNGNVLRVAAAEVAGAIPVTDVSARLSAIADIVLRWSLLFAEQALASRHGRPGGGPDGREPGFLIVAYGKLGSREMNYGSDLDLVFLHADGVESGASDGPAPLDNPVWFARLARRVLHVLTTVTPGGRLYEADMRLRPSGASGLLVSSLAAFTGYQRERAWTWEHQALLRARPVCGDAALADAFRRTRRAILASARPEEVLRDDVRAMRDRMRAELHRPEPGRFDLKHGPGGITDVEFMVQYEALRGAPAHPDILERTDTLGLLDALSGAGVVGEAKHADLSAALLAYRAAIHRQTLQEQPARVDEDEFAALRARVIRWWRETFGDGETNGEGNGVRS